eukprot:g17350.t1
MGRYYTFTGYRERCRGAVGCVESEGRIDQAVLKGQERGRGLKYVAGGGISLEVAEVASDDLLDVDAGKDKGNPIAVVGGKRRAENGSAGGGPDLVE